MKSQTLSSCSARLAEMHLPGAYDFDQEGGVVFTRFWGVVEDGDLTAVRRAIARDPDIRPPIYELVDLRGVENLAVTSRGIQAVVDIDMALREKASLRIATALVAEEEVAFGMARMFELLSSSRNSPRYVEVFRNAEEALNWLLSRQEGG